ncbi:cysteine desulfurase family protein [Rhodospirillaceae bacterium SYSU D60014]|uniref:cysteine desulfurase family protein n=1 Tax=Virgifigura deserti TaxID=2268457 RepID=UPI000E65F556
MDRAVYLDYNATAPARPAVIAAMARALALCGNPSSVHQFGRTARRQVEEARERVAALVHARPEQVTFTSGGTEANNLALTGTGRDRLVLSAIEHDSVLRAAPEAEILPVSTDGIVDLAALAEGLGRDPRPALLSVMLANNETGVIQPVAEAAEIARAHGALLHCDAVQAAGKVPLDITALGVDLLSLSAHKLGGPQGIGALVVGDDLALRPLLRGGGQERSRRAGTENVAAIVGFGVAAEEAAAELPAQGRIAQLRDRLERRVRETAPEARVFGAASPRLPNTSCFAWAGMPSETQVMALDLAGIAVSAGSACSSGKVRASHVLRAMGATVEEAGSAIRVSLGWRSTEVDIDRFIEAWSGLVTQRPNHRSDRSSAA